MPSQTLESWLETIALHEPLRPHVTHVMRELPDHVLCDLIHDPAFVLCDVEPGGFVPVRLGQGTPGRSVVLKRALTRQTTSFIQWVIAHELAHAHLRNRGRTETEDPEHAADALAADWGFPKPPRGTWRG